MSSTRPMSKNEYNQTLVTASRGGGGMRYVGESDAAYASRLAEAKAAREALYRNHRTSARSHGTTPMTRDVWNGYNRL